MTIAAPAAVNGRRAARPIKYEMAGHVNVHSTRIENSRWLRRRGSPRICGGDAALYVAERPCRAASLAIGPEVKSARFLTNSNHQLSTATRRWPWRMLKTELNVVAAASSILLSSRLIDVAISTPRRRK